jgi:hypothetical protein
MLDFAGQAASKKICDDKAKTAKTDTKDSDKGLTNFEKLLAVLGVVIPAVPGIILSTKGGYTQPPVATYPPTSGGNSYGETPAEKAAREAASKPPSSGIPKMVWYGVGGFVLLVIGVFAFRHFANKGAK